MNIRITSEITPAANRHPLSPILNSTNTPQLPSPFSTPRHRKNTRNNYVTPSRPSQKWPRIGRKIPSETLEDITKQIFGYSPRGWQTKVAEKVLEGHDAIVIAGTGAGKSLVFAMLAIAAELAGFKGVVIVICPLKSLQKDQVRRLTETEPVTLPQQSQPLKLSAVAINEDNHDDKIFTDLAKGLFRICYASPECLLHNPRFKKLFRQEDFRKRVISMVVDEAHVIEDWKNEFRKDYGELETLKIIMGIEIPWLAVTGMSSTETFEIIYRTLGMGGARPFYGVDRGSDRPNLKQWVRPMEYPASSLADLLVFVPKTPAQPSDFPKAIFYLNTCQLARHACDLCRSVVVPEFRKCLYAYTAVNSEDFKEKIMDLLREGKQLRWVFAMIAAGMGMDIPDIELAVIFGTDNFKSAFQKGGRAGRDVAVKATMVWIVEPWAFKSVIEREENNGDRQPTSKKALADAKRRDNMDPASREYINRSQSTQCMRAYATTHLRPRPNLPGFPWYQPSDDLDWDDECNEQGVIWEVVGQEIGTGPDCGCSSLVCHIDPDMPVGVLSDADRQLIAHHLGTQQRQRSQGISALSITMSVSPAEVQLDIHSAPPLRCSKPEWEILQQALLSWRDTQWAAVRADYPFFSREWIITDSNLGHLVERAHVLLNSTQIDADLVRGLIKCISDEATIASLVSVLQEFRTTRHERDFEERANRRPKRGRIEHNENTDPFLDSFVPSSSSNIVQWQIQNYSHERYV